MDEINVNDKLNLTQAQKNYLFQIIEKEVAKETMNLIEKLNKQIYSIDSKLTKQTNEIDKRLIDLNEKQKMLFDSTTALPDHGNYIIQPVLYENRVLTAATSADDDNESITDNY